MFDSLKQINTGFSDLIRLFDDSFAATTDLKPISERYGRKDYEYRHKFPLRRRELNKLVKNRLLSTKTVEEDLVQESATIEALRKEFEAISSKSVASQTLQTNPSTDEACQVITVDDDEEAEPNIVVIDSDDVADAETPDDVAAAAVMTSSNQSHVSSKSKDAKKDRKRKRHHMDKKRLEPEAAPKKTCNKIPKLAEIGSISNRIPKRKNVADDYTESFASPLDSNCPTNKRSKFKSVAPAAVCKQNQSNRKPIARKGGKDVASTRVRVEPRATVETKAKEKEDSKLLKQKNTSKSGTLVKKHSFGENERPKMHDIGDILSLMQHKPRNSEIESAKQKARLNPPNAPPLPRASSLLTLPPPLPQQQTPICPRNDEIVISDAEDEEQTLNEVEVAPVEPEIVNYAPVPKPIRQHSPITSLTPILTYRVMDAATFDMYFRWRYQLSSDVEYLAVHCVSKYIMTIEFPNGQKIQFPAIRTPDSDIRTPHSHPESVIIRQRARIRKGRQLHKQ